MTCLGGVEIDKEVVTSALIRRLTSEFVTEFERGNPRGGESRHQSVFERLLVTRMFPVLEEMLRQFTARISATR